MLGFESKPDFPYHIASCNNCNLGPRVMQLAAAILSQLNMPPAEVASAVETFRRNHIQELQVTSGWIIVSPPNQAHDTSLLG
jgi:hypothetical protein